MGHFIAAVLGTCPQPGLSKCRSARLLGRQTLGDTQSALGTRQLTRNATDTLRAHHRTSWLVGGGQAVLALSGAGAGVCGHL